MGLRLAIVGRPNVGKSTLFNKLTRKKLAIVDDTPGVTRDWKEARATLFGLDLLLIDTAGFEDPKAGDIQALMRAQTEGALDHAGAALMIVDGRQGITAEDRDLARMLRTRNLPVVLAVNKCEGAQGETLAAQGFELGLGTPVQLSAEHGIGFDDLYQRLQEIWQQIEPSNQGDTDTDQDQNDDDDADEDTDADGRIRLAIVGRPNVGKSTLLNGLLGQRRVMTGPQAGLTRDTVTADWEYKGKAIKLIDTAGMRRKSRVHDKIERMSVDEARRAVRLAQVVILVIDAVTGLDRQEQNIARMVLDEGRGLVIALNKWDAVKNKNETREETLHRIEMGIAQVRGLVVQSISAENAKNLDRLMDHVLDIHTRWATRISTGKLNRWLEEMTARKPAPLVSGKSQKLRYMTQIKSRPPTFAVWVSRPDDLPESYQRYLMNGLRKRFDLEGVPVRLKLKTSDNPYG